MIAFEQMYVKQNLTILKIQTETHENIENEYILNDIKQNHQTFHHKIDIAITRKGQGSRTETFLFISNVGHKKFEQIKIRHAGIVKRSDAEKFPHSNNT
jgi:hypothetical protein